MWRSIVRLNRRAEAAATWRPPTRVLHAPLAARYHATATTRSAASANANSNASAPSAASPATVGAALATSNAVPAAAGDGWRQQRGERWYEQMRAVWRAPPEANTGSVARDHLANERTFLAWSRTGLAFVGVGIGLNMGLSHEQLIEIVPGLHLFRTQLPVLCFVAAGSTFVAYATARYFRVTRLLQRGLYAVNTSGVALMIGVSACIVVAGLVLLIRHPRHNGGGPQLNPKLAQVLGVTLMSTAAPQHAHASNPLTAAAATPSPAASTAAVTAADPKRS